MAEITLEHSPVSPSNPAKVSLCAKQDGNILHLDTVDLTREDRREVFVKGLIEKNEALQPQKEAIEKRDDVSCPQTACATKETHG